MYTRTCWSVFKRIMLSSTTKIKQLMNRLLQSFTFLQLHFFCPFVQANEDFVKSYNSSMQDMTLSCFDLLEPLPSCQLQIARNTGMPSKGGYLSSFTNVFEITMCSSVCPIVTKDNKINVYDAHHFPDSKIFLTPDLYAKEENNLYPNPKRNHQAAQDYYITKLNADPSNRVAGRQYVKHSYYHDVKQCFPNAFTIDLSMFAEDKQVLIHIVTKTDYLNQVVEQTTVKIQRTKSNLWDHIKNVGKHIVDECNSKKSKVYAIRENPLTDEECQKINMPSGFEGAMYAIGKHVNHYAKTEAPSKQKYVYYKRTQDLMPGLS